MLSALKDLLTYLPWAEKMHETMPMLFHARAVLIELS